MSGDYCDLIVSGDAGGLFFAAGDVAGKGIAASLLMSHLNAIFRTLLSVGVGLTDLVDRANRVFCESTMPSHYATLVCGRAMPSSDVELCNAGHCPPLLVRGGAASAIEEGGLPLGLFCDSRYSARRMHLQPGDSLVLYTDGLTEARDRSGVEYGAGRLGGVLGARHGSPPADLLAAVLVDVATFLAGNSKPDDLTVLVIQRSR